jgi:hypothetical protein
MFGELNKGKAAALTEIDKVVASNVVFHMADGSEIRGLKDFKQHESNGFDAVPDVHYTLDDIVVEGDKAVARFTVTGTHKGALMGIPPTNKKVKYWGIDIFHVVGGKLIEGWQRADTLGLMQQLGVVPMPKK